MPEAFEFGAQLTVIERRPEAAEIAPDFAIDHFDGEAIRRVHLAGGQDVDLGHQILSGHRAEECGRSYGVLITEWRTAVGAARAATAQPAPSG